MNKYVLALVAMLLAVPASAQQTVVGERLRIADESQLSGDVGHPDYISQLQRWLIEADGSADFRYLFTDELHAKSFIADLEQALAGGQIISKSVAVLASNFTNPAAGLAATITVRDLPSAENMAVFESGDTIRLRSFSRAAGSLTIADSYGVVTAYADQPGGVQNWTFTRNAGADAGSMSAGAIIEADAIVLDYGTSGNGYHEINAIDGLYGVNSPYSQVVTWSAGAPISANLTVRSRIGNLRGITGTTGEYGLIAGTYAATGGQYMRASNQAVELHGVNLLMWDGATNTIKLDRTAPSFALGSPVPTAYGTGPGIWMGKDAGAYKFRVGDPAGARLTWDGTTLAVVGVDGAGITNINGGNIQTGTVSAAKLTVGTGLNLIRNSECRTSTEDWATSTTTGLPITVGFNLSSDWRLADQVGTCYFTISGTPAAGTQSNAYLSNPQQNPVIAGQKYEMSAYLGVHGSGDTQVFIFWYDSALAFLSSSGGSVCVDGQLGGHLLTGYCRSGLIATAPAGAAYARWMVLTTHKAGVANPFIFFVRAYFGEALANQTELTPWGGSGVTEITGGIIKTDTITASHIATDTITANKIAANAITTSELNADAVTSAKIAAGTIVASDIAAGTITADRLNVSSLSAVSANLGTVTAGHIDGATAEFGGGDVDLNSNGITIVSAAGDSNKIKWTDGSSIFAELDTLWLQAQQVIMDGLPSGDILADTHFYPNQNGSKDLGQSALRWRKLYANDARINNLAGTGTRAVCADDDGDLVICP